jgi:hypothetical protein
MADGPSHAATVGVPAAGEVDGKSPTATATGYFYLNGIMMSTAKIPKWEK